MDDSNKWYTVVNNPLGRHYNCRTSISVSGCALYVFACCVSTIDIAIGKLKMISKPLVGFRPIDFWFVYMCTHTHTHEWEHGSSVFARATLARIGETWTSPFNFIVLWSSRMTGDCAGFVLSVLAVLGTICVSSVVGYGQKSKDFKTQPLPSYRRRLYSIVIVKKHFWLTQLRIAFTLYLEHSNYSFVLGFQSQQERHVFHSAPTGASSIHFFVNVWHAFHFFLFLYSFFFYGRFLLFHSIHAGYACSKGVQTESVECNSTKNLQLLNH